MSTESTIHEPFLLQSYSSSRRHEKAKALVYASSSPSITSTDGYLTVAAQGDGVHLLDVSALHPVISHTLGPSTTFSCAPVTRASADGQTISTYAAVASSSDLSKVDENKTIWSWTDTLSGAEVSPKKAITLSHDILALYLHSDLLLALSSNGSLTVLTHDLIIRRTEEPITTEWTVYKAFCFPSDQCSFASSGSVSLVLLETFKDASRIRAVTLCIDMSPAALGGVSIPFKLSEISDASCNSAGYFSVLTRDGAWHSYQLSSSPITLSTSSSALELQQLSEPIHLASTLTCASLLALQASFVLLAVKTTHRKIALLIWDLRFGIVLAAQTLDDPTDAPAVLELIPSSSSTNVVVAVSHPPALDAKNKKSSIFVVPYAAPGASTIAGAMGKAVMSQAWLKKDDEGGTVSSVREQLDEDKNKLLGEMNTAMEQKRPQSASQAFFAWQKAEKAKEDGHLVYGYSFVKELLVACLQPTKPVNYPYSSDVVRHLIQAGAVSASMVDVGLLSLLRIRNDWTSVQLALKHVTDLLELELIDCLRHIASINANPDAMQVDSETPSLLEILSLCVNYSCSPVALRTAIRRCLSDAVDLTRILEVLDLWLGQWGGREVPLMPTKKAIDQNKHGVVVIDLKKEGKQGKGSGDIPAVHEIVVFLQAILDASLLTLLQHTPAHRVLRRINGRVDVEIRTVDQVQPLRGPLEPFVDAQRRALMAAQQGNEQTGDWRQKSKLAHERNAGTIGLYQVERLVL